MFFIFSSFKSFLICPKTIVNSFVISVVESTKFVRVEVSDLITFNPCSFGSSNFELLLPPFNSIYLSPVIPKFPKKA
jgi:hypothetical protein